MNLSVIPCYTHIVPGRDVRAEEPGTGGNFDLPLLMENGTYSLIELKYAVIEDKVDGEKILRKLAKKGIAAVDVKRYGKKSISAGKNAVKIGLGVYGRGMVLFMFESEPMEVNMIKENLIEAELAKADC
jgi:hypothetical protein